MNDKTRRWFVAAVLSILLAMLTARLTYVYQTADILEIDVVKVERVTFVGGKLSSKYLVYAFHETFENTDSLWYWKWNSSDLHGQLSRGGRFKVKVYGWRMPFFSMYRNIVEVKGVFE